MEKNLTDFLKEPLSSGRLKLILALMVFIASMFVNAYFQVTSFSALVEWFLKASGVTDIQQQLNQILSQSDMAIGIRIAFGLLMTMFVMVFLLLAAYWEEKEKNIKHLFERACSTMLIPLLLMVTATLLMNVSFVAGIFFGVGAAINCVSVIISSGKKAKVNGYLLILTSTAFFLITVVLLTRNHFVTMFGIY